MVVSASHHLYPFLPGPSRQQLLKAGVRVAEQAAAHPAVHQVREVPQLAFAAIATAGRIIADVEVLRLEWRKTREMQFGGNMLLQI